MDLNSFVFDKFLSSGYSKTILIVCYKIINKRKYYYLIKLFKSENKNDEYINGEKYELEIYNKIISEIQKINNNFIKTYGTDKVSFPIFLNKIKGLKQQPKLYELISTNLDIDKNMINFEIEYTILI